MPLRQWVCDGSDQGCAINQNQGDATSIMRDHAGCCKPCSPLQGPRTYEPALEHGNHAVIGIGWLFNLRATCGCGLSTTCDRKLSESVSRS